MVKRIKELDINDIEKMDLNDIKKMLEKMDKKATRIQNEIRAELGKPLIEA